MALLKPFQLSIVKTLLGNYHFDQPFNTYFAAQSKLHRNWGSKDRKTYKNACYAYFRLGFAIGKGSIESNVLFANRDINELLSEITPQEIFPNRDWISTKMDFESWAKSLLSMRPVYLVVVDGCSEKVTAWLDSHGIEFEWINGNGIKVKADSKCNELVESGWAWIMDIASQYAAGSIDIKPGEEVWDACCGGGGKALYLSNKFGSGFNLTCSDLRFTSLENLKSRFYATGLKMPRVELADLNESFQIKAKYDKVLLDVPCSGSGTWGRNPESIRTINHDKIRLFSNLQRNIVRNAIKNLGADGCLYYITCSVFRDENEDNVRYFTENFGLDLMNEKYLVSDYRESDILYLAELKFK